VHFVGSVYWCVAAVRGGEYLSMSLALLALSFVVSPAGSSLGF
jgi:hypothetical protein